jgi:hypothetical protein
MNHAPRWVLLMKKNGGGKSRATVPLFSFEGIRNSVYTNLHGIPRN